MTRTAILLYGILVYFFFFGVFLYFFGFMNNLFVPKSVDVGGVTDGPMWQAAAINIGLVALFGIQHAIMARPAFKRWLTRYIAPALERSTFVLIASMLLVLLYVLWQPMPTVIWDVQQPAARAIILGVFFAGIAIVLLSSFLIDHFDLFGLRQVWLNFRGQPYTQRPFVLRSMYKYVRHPLMTGFILSLWAAPTMTVGHAIFSAAFTAYIIIGTRIEERDLIAQHGESYMRYSRVTPRFFPRPGGRSTPETVAAA